MRPLGLSLALLLLALATVAGAGPSLACETSSDDLGYVQAKRGTAPTFASVYRQPAAEGHHHHTPHQHNHGSPDGCCMLCCPAAATAPAIVPEAEPLPAGELPRVVFVAATEALAKAITGLPYRPPRTA